MKIVWKKLRNIHKAVRKKIYVPGSQSIKSFLVDHRNGRVNDSKKNY